MLTSLNKLIAECKATTSINEKVEIIKRHPECKDALVWTYDPFVQFGVTPDNVKKKGPTQAVAISPKLPASLKEVLEQLAAREITGNHAIAVTYLAAETWGDTVYRIIDKDLKCRIDSTLINRAFPGLIREFNVALAKSYDDHKKKVNLTTDIWLASRKLDGVRCIAVVDNQGNTKFFSRTGKEFFTLCHVAQVIKIQGLKTCVLDGEMCIVDKNGNEDFTAIVSEIRRKNHDIARPRYKLFDMLTPQEFWSAESQATLTERLGRLEKSIKPSGVLEILHQEVVVDQAHFDEWKERAAEGGWEGFMLRKDCPYEGKRTANLLKVKEFMDAEYKVVSIEHGPITFIEDGQNKSEVMMTKVNIIHKGNEVGVGSGWSMDQRREFYKHPERIVGKTITVQYFSETTDSKTGKPSLRFPTVKAIYDNKRDV